MKNVPKYLMDPIIEIFGVIFKIGANSELLGNDVRNLLLSLKAYNGMK